MLKPKVIPQLCPWLGHTTWLFPTIIWESKAGSNDHGFSSLRTHFHPADVDCSLKMATRFIEHGFGYAPSAAEDTAPQQRERVAPNASPCTLSPPTTIIT